MGNLAARDNLVVDLQESGTALAEAGSLVSEVKHNGVLARLNHTPIVYAFASRSKGATPPIEPHRHLIASVVLVFERSA